MDKAYGYEMKKNKGNEKMEEDFIKLSALDTYIKGISNNQARKICIFGAGKYGIDLYNELSSKLIYIDCFIDNNRDRWGYCIDNKECLSPIDLIPNKDEFLVIVASLNPRNMKRQIEELEFPYITTKQELQNTLSNTPPVKWMIHLEELENVDYNSEGIKHLVNRFNETIYELCRYYENRRNN